MLKKPLAAALSAAVGLAIAMSAHAGPYPVQTCVSAKMKSAATKCKADLKTWSKWESTQDNASRDAALGASATKLSDGWTKAETKSLAKGVDCVDTTATSADEVTAINTAINDIVTDINTGLVLTNADDAKCGAALLKAASKKCNSFLKAESKFVKKLAQDPQGTARDAAKTSASSKFAAALTSVGATCAAHAANTETKVDDLSAGVVTDTTVSPNVATAWTAVTPPTSVDYSGTVFHPLCSRSTPYMYFVKRGTGDDAHKLLMYYMGGGACWDAVTCAASTGAFHDAVTAGDNPANTTTGFGDLTNPSNPFRNWSAVFVAYCTGDVHWGDNDKLYLAGPPYGNQNIKHRGYENAKVAEKWAREHFVEPTEVFVTGSSAGAYGAVLHGIFLHDVYPASKMNVIGDAGNGVITREFLTQNIEQSWHVQQHLPTYIPGLNADITTLTIADLYGKSAAFYESRGSRFGQYTTAWDGSPGGQVFFYNVMVNGITDNVNIQHSSCAWNTQMRQFDLNALADAPNNYRYYIGPGSRHTIYGSNRVYTETHGGVQTFVSWLNDMRSGGTWNNANCTPVDCSLLGNCNGGLNDTASCQHDSECPGGVCNLVDAKPPFTCSPASTNSGASCQRDADCPGGNCQIEAAFGVCSANSTSNPNKLCSSNSDCPGGTCVTEQPFGLDGVVTCP